MKTADLTPRLAVAQPTAPRERESCMRDTALALVAAGFLLTLASSAFAHDNIARTVTVQGGPYSIQVGMMTDPPTVETPLDITVTAASGAPALKGATVTLTAVPGLGTDGVTSKAYPMTAEPAEPASFETKIPLPVRGAWLLKVEVDGPAGKGTATLPVTVAAPAAMPIWLGWLIGMSPSLGLVWFAWWNRRYFLRIRSEARA
jgi:hypothetical protein